MQVVALKNPKKKKNGVHPLLPNDLIKLKNLKW